MNLRIIKPKNKLSLFIILALIVSFSGSSEVNQAWASDHTASTRFQTASRRLELPVAPERNPPGDIPDSQVFINYTSAQGGYSLAVPEGWARTTTNNTVMFQDKLDGLTVTISKADKLPNVRGIHKNQAARLKKTARAVIIRQIKHIRSPNNMPAMLMRYESNSEPNPVTSKQVRLENNSYFFYQNYQNGKLAELRLWAPLGADNVDQWRLISHSFKWR